MRKLKDEELSEYKNKAKRYRRMGEVEGIKLSSKILWYSERGAKMQSSPGDWLISDGKKIWTIKEKEFVKGYMKFGIKYRKKGEILAYQVDEDYEIDTLEGVGILRKGDYICWSIDTESKDKVWPVAEKDFQCE